MEFEEIKRRWFEAKEGIIPLSDLQQVKHVGDILHRYYICPCGSEDHYGSRPYDPGALLDEYGCVLTCYDKNKQWLIKKTDIQQMIRTEEEHYIKLLEKAPSVVKKVIAKRGWSEETKAFLLDTHGIDPELAESIMEDLNKGILTCSKE